MLPEKYLFLPLISLYFLSFRSLSLPLFSNKHNLNFYLSYFNFFSTQFAYFHSIFSLIFFFELLCIQIYINFSKTMNRTCIGVAQMMFVSGLFAKYTCEQPVGPC